MFINSHMPHNDFSVYDGGSIILYYIILYKGNKTIPEKVATKRTEDGHK